MWLLMELMFTEHSNKPLLVKQLWDAAMGHTVGIIGRHRNLAFWILSIERRFEQFVSVSKCKQDSQGFNLFFCNSLRGLIWFSYILKCPMAKSLVGSSMRIRLTWFFWIINI